MKMLSPNIICTTSTGSKAHTTPFTLITNAPSGPSAEFARSTLTSSKSSREETATGPSSSGWALINAAYTSGSPSIERIRQLLSIEWTWTITRMIHLLEEEIYSMPLMIRRLPLFVIICGSINYIRRALRSGLTILHGAIRRHLPITEFGMTWW